MIPVRIASVPADRADRSVSLATRDVIQTMFWLAHEQTARKHYREERAMPEWFDYGGEA